MPTFSPSQSVTARATLPVKPAGLACQAELYLGTGKVATSGKIAFTSTGASQTINLPIIMPSSGTYPVLLDITTDSLVIGAFYGTENVVIAAPDVLTLSFTKPKSSSTTHWDARLYDIASRSRQNSVITPLGQYVVLKPTGLTFLLSIGEWLGGIVYGPYLVTIPGLGYYVWNASTERIDGIQGQDLAATSNKSSITGLVQSQLGSDTLILTVESVAAVSGYLNAAQYFVGSALTIKVDLPMSAGNYLLTIGQRVAVVASLVYDSSPISYWKGDSITPMYPPFSASGTFTFDPWYNAPRETWSPGIKYSNVTGNRPSFTIVGVMVNEDGYGLGWSYATVLGSGSSGVLRDFFSWGVKLIVLAHPDPGKSLPPGLVSASAYYGWIQLWSYYTG